MKKKLSNSIKVLIWSSTILIVFTAIVLYLMAVHGIPEPTTLILSFFGAFGATQLGNVFLNGIKQKAEARMEELVFNAEGPCERTLSEMNKTYLGGANDERMANG